MEYVRTGVCHAKCGGGKAASQLPFIFTGNINLGTNENGREVSMAKVFFKIENVKSEGVGAQGQLTRGVNWRKS